jgi:DNA-binding NtrC family response regulator
MQEQRHPMSQVRVLLVDDDPDFARIFQISLRAEKRFLFEIATVTTLQSALQTLQEKNFQLILLDLGLPDSQGLGTLEKIVSAHPEIACVILSGTDDEALSLEAVKKGAQDYVVKGEARGEMLARILSYALERNLQKQKIEELNEHLEKLSFLDPLTQTPQFLQLLLAVLKSLNSRIIAEGIETREDLETLKELGIPYGQGFLWGQPG